MTASAVPPVTDHLPVALRAFAAPHVTLADATKKPRRPRSKPGASDWTLIFDTETFTDPGQALRFGSYQVRQADALQESGLFYEPAHVSADELDRLRLYTQTNSLRLLTRDRFVDDILFGIAWTFRATIIGFNLPFDISRIAISHATARTSERAGRQDMRCGFTFKLSSQKIYPPILIRHVSQRTAFIRFGSTFAQQESRGERGRGIKTPHRAGHFVDVKTLAGALLARNFSLASLCEHLEVAHPKLDFDDYSGPITAEMIDYAARDVQATWECFALLRDRLAGLGIPNLPPEKVYSEASIGKGYVRAMRIPAWRDVQPDFPRQMLANIMGSYFGGRSEVRIRRELRQVMLCDFLSMYPTVCTLMGLWWFVIGDGMRWHDSTEATRAFLETVSLDTLQSPSTWDTLTTLVRVIPDGEIFPVRAAYAGEAQSTIGANHLTADVPLWFTLADCIAAKLLTDRVPQVVEAVTFAPGPPHEGLEPIDIGGNPDYRVDPIKTDFFKRVIELRQTVKLRMKAASGAEREALDIEQNALKIAANATSYGMYAEMNVSTRSHRVRTTVHSSTCAPFGFQTDKAEEPGVFFHPLLAASITGAARLMLAIAETLAAQRGLEWAFCDTDSMAFARPENMTDDAFRAHVGEIVEWFAALNPYDFDGSILKIEDQNYSLATGEPEPLYCWAVSAKRYALFNLDAEGKPIMRKVSAHGLGHLRPPYTDDDPPANVHAPHPSVLKDGVLRWYHDHWYSIISAALAGAPNRVATDYHPDLSRPAVSRYGATSPGLLQWFRRFNDGRPYRDQVKPFGFMLAFTARLGFLGERIVENEPKRRRIKTKPVKPVAPFDRDAKTALAHAFDRDTRKPIVSDMMMSYAEALAPYHLHPESKFLNGEPFDRGTTRPRHVHMTSTRHIGKESHDWERQAVLGLDPDAQPDYGIGDADRERLLAELKALVDWIGGTKVAKALGITPARLKRFVGKGLPPALIEKVPAIVRLFHRLDQDRQNETSVWRQAVERDGLRATARRLGIDPSNLRRKLNHE